MLSWSRPMNRSFNTKKELTNFSINNVPKNIQDMHFGNLVDGRINWALIESKLLFSSSAIHPSNPRLQIEFLNIQLFNSWHVLSNAQCNAISVLVIARALKLKF